MLHSKDTHNEIIVDGVARPVTNSAGAKIAATDDGLVAFWRWFRNSSVVDHLGRPLVVHHGTTADFHSFEPAYSGSDGVRYGTEAIFTTCDRNLASDYALNKFNREIGQAMREMQRYKNENPGVYDDEYERRYSAVRAALTRARGSSETGEGANVMPLYLAIENALVVEGGGRGFMDVVPSAVAEVTAGGHDGAIMHNVIDHASDQSKYPATIYFATHRGQLKSAIGNDGTFDPKDPSILRSIGHQASELDARVASLAATGSDASAILRVIAEESSEPHYVEVAQALLRLNLQTQIQFDQPSASTSGATASYDTLRDIAVLRKVQGAQGDIVHELVHAATEGALRAGGPVAKRMETLWRFARQHPALQGAYGLESPSEFVAEAFTNVDFRAQLRQIPSPDVSTSLWKKMVAVIRSALRCPEIKLSALDEVLAAGSDLLHSNSRPRPSALSDCSRVERELNYGRQDNTKRKIPK